MAALTIDKLEEKLSFWWRLARSPFGLPVGSADGRNSLPIPLR